MQRMMFGLVALVFVLAQSEAFSQAQNEWRRSSAPRKSRRSSARPAAAIGKSRSSTWASSTSASPCFAVAAIKAGRADGRHQPHEGDRGVLRRLRVGDDRHRRRRRERPGAGGQQRAGDDGGRTRQQRDVQEAGAEPERSRPATSSSFRRASTTASAKCPTTSNMSRSGRMWRRCCRRATSTRR